MGQGESDRADQTGSAREPFDEFYLREYPAVVGLLQGLLRSRLVAEELAQETFLVAYRDWARVSGLDNPRAWIRRVALNQRGSFLRAYLRQQAREQRSVMQEDDDSIKLADDHAEVWQAIRTLPPSQAQVIALVDAATGLREIVLSDVRQELAAADGAPAEAPTSRILRRSQRLALVVNLLLVVALSVLLARVASHREDPVAAAPAVTATIPPPAVTALAARSKVPEACLDAAELADEVISRLNRNQRDNALATALRDYTIASQACRREAGS